MDNNKKGDTFTDKIEENFYYGNNRDKTRLGNRGTLDENTISAILGKGAQGDAVKRTINDVAGSRSSGISKGTGRGASFQGRVYQSAHDAGSWIENVRDIAPIELDIKSGSESEVFQTNDGITAVKVMNLSYYRNAEDLIYRIAAHNSIFKNDKYELTGFTLNRDGRTSAVLKQPLVLPQKDTNGKIVKPTQKQIDAEMQKLGFKPVEGLSGVYENGELRVSDIAAENNNVLLDENGQLRFIDPFIIPSKLSDSKQTIPSDGNIEKAKVELGKLLGKDFKTGFITDSDVRHTKNNHGKNEESRGQINITPEDLALVPFVMNEFDSVTHTVTDKLGNRKVEFVKKINGTVYVASIERGKDKEQKPGRVADAKSPSPTSETTPDGVAKIQQIAEELRNSAKNSSKVVDENGEPLVVYHGSRGNYDFAEFHIPPWGESYFTDNRSVAELFAKEAAYTIVVDGVKHKIDTDGAEDILSNEGNLVRARLKKDGRK